MDKPNYKSPTTLVETNMMQTYQGRMVNMLDIRPGDISIVDIAHALALTNRYGGHSPFPLSVAQHSLMVSQVLPDEFKLWGLLHDGAEAYLGDIIHPLKVHLEVYQTFEQALMFIIAQRFGLVWPEPAEVKVADLAVGATECAQFGIPVNERREAQTIPHLLPIQENSWRVVEAEFLDEFTKLRSGA